MNKRRSAEQDVSTVHRPVLVREVLQHLQLQPGLCVVDGTVGGGGHSLAIARRIVPGGTLIGLDRDPEMVARARHRLSEETLSLHFFSSSYAEISTVLSELDAPHADRILVDLGLSSDQLADQDRGFGFQSGGPLDLRFNPALGKPASEFLAHCTAEQLQSALEQFGEEPFADRITRAVISKRRAQPIRTAEQLAELVLAAVPAAIRSDARKHPATRVFQALRIIVNEELDHLERALRETFPASLSSGGRLAVITFHSLEDRIVKESFQDEDRWQIVTAKPVMPTATERKINPRSRTAKLRVAIRR